MGKIHLPRKSPIGIDLGAHSIKAVQLGGHGGKWRLQAAATIPRTAPAAPFDTAEIVRLCTVLNRAGFSGTCAVLPVPAAELMTGMLELPPRAPELPFDQIARMEFARVHKCEPAGFQLSYWDLPEPARASKTTHVMAIGYTHAAADKHLDIVEAGGIDVIGLDSASSAIARACEALATSATTAILDIGYAGTSLGLSQDGTLTYERRMPESGIRPLISALKKQLELSDDEINYLLWDGGLGEPGERRGAEVFADARRMITSHFAVLIEELRVTFSYTEHEYPDAPAKLMLLVGGGAAIPGVALYLQQQLAMDVRPAKPTDVVECPPELLERATPAIMTALGLAMFSEGRG